MKTFNIIANCLPDKHYMVDTSNKLDQIMKMIERGDYFIINRPRQFGKTTTIFLLWQRLADSGEYIPIFSSFEEWDDVQFEASSKFCRRLLKDIIQFININDSANTGLFDDMVKEVVDFDQLFEVLIQIINKTRKKIVLFIDEVDRSSNNELFLKFLGLLRSKYIRAKAGFDTTFHSVILAGLHDIKSLKQKIRPESESQLNSPWNIAVKFSIDMSFSSSEIETMLADYVAETGVKMDTKAISERIYFWTSGYPFLVSEICRIMAEEVLPQRENKEWEVRDIDAVVKGFDDETNTLFDVLTKNLVNDKKIYDFLEGIALGTEKYKFNLKTQLINQIYMYGYIKSNEKGDVQIYNRIFERIITDYIIDTTMQRNANGKGNIDVFQAHYIKPDGRLDIEKALIRFQEVMKEKYHKGLFTKTEKFLEKDLRLLFLMFMQPILNGKGFSYQEVEISEERRLDVVITFSEERFVVELKLWNGPKYHAEGKQRLKRYMQAMSIEKGYMLILDRTRKKAFKRIRESGILMVYV